MSKIAHYLQEHLSGEVIFTEEARKYFSTDGGVFEVMPSIIVYPRNENDVRKTTRFSWQLAERGRTLPITARGRGSDQGGAAIGQGIILVFPTHMNKIIEFDGKSGDVIVEPGLVYSKLQQTLHTHGRFLPPYPSSIEFSTLGGAVANNASGEKTIKYGNTRNYVKGLRVVLANGEVIETRRLSKRELNKKMGLSTFEGEIYRAVDTLIEENSDAISTIDKEVTKNSAGYAIDNVKLKNGSFDLTPLIVGSQGTLGVVSEAIISTEPYNPKTTLIVANFSDVQSASEAVLQMRKMPEIPSAIEVVDDNLLNFIDGHNPTYLKGIVDKPFPKLILLIELDNQSERTQSKMSKKIQKILKKQGAEFVVERDEHAKEELWKIRHSAASVITQTEGNAKALPIVEDGIVPVDKFSEYLAGVYEIFEKNNLKIAIWGHAGNANLHMQPFLDLSQVGDRQKVFKIIEDYYSLVISLGGSTSGEHNDGRLRAPYLKKLYGEEVYEVFNKIKTIFDPHNILNPGVKMNVTIDDIKPLLRNEYSMDHLYDHLPGR
ncbi:MAG TPA: FAD-binding oxidoreductase [Candidatus Saccharibacteria bacterium]|nr:FAD-binding oxidoreductase [Candidatus Saccharibacteria bacterium]